MQHTPAQIQQGSQGCTNLLFSSNEACVLHEGLFGLSFLTSLLILAEFYECAFIICLNWRAFFKLCEAEAVTYCFEACSKRILGLRRGVTHSSELKEAVLWISCRVFRVWLRGSAVLPGVGYISRANSVFLFLRTRFLMQQIHLWERFCRLALLHTAVSVGSDACTSLLTADCFLSTNLGDWVSNLRKCFVTACPLLHFLHPHPHYPRPPKSLSWGCTTQFLRIKLENAFLFCCV